MTGRALVTGANGFVGSAVVRALLRRGRAVRGFVRPDSDRGGLAGRDVELVEGDLRDGDALRAALNGIEDAYFVAADYRLWVRDPAALYAVNVDAAAQAVRLAAAAGVGRIVHTSSVAAIKPPTSGPPSDETTATSLKDLVGPYKQSKHLGEIAVMDMARETGAPVVVVNPSTPIGPRDAKPTPTGKAVLATARGDMPAFVDSGLNVAHVDDVAMGHILAARKGAIGERYILGGDDMTLADVFQIAAQAAGRGAPRMKLPHDLLWPVAAAGEIYSMIARKEPMLTFDTLRMSKKRMFFSCDKAKRDLGYTPRPGAQAIQDAVAWYREHGYLA